jgi:predicted nucleotide-binding protein
MARRTITPQSPQPGVLTPDQLKRGIQLLTKRLDTVEKFDPTSVGERRFKSPELVALMASVEEAIFRTFGTSERDFERYVKAARFTPYGEEKGNIPLNEVHEYLSDKKEDSIVLLRQAIVVLNERLGEFDDDSGAQSTATLKVAAFDSRKVFLVHGHDGEPKQAVARFLEGLDFQVVILREQANQGLTIIEKFEENADVGMAVVLLTPDDLGRAKSEADLRPRARQNVVLELGYFIGRLGRSRVCALKQGDVEVPSDISGVVYVPYDANGAWQVALGQELERAGYDIDWNTVMRGKR